MTALVMFSALLPGVPPWVFLMVVVFLPCVFAPQMGRRSKRTVALFALLLLFALARVGYSAKPNLVYYPYACQQDQSEWTWWLLCHLM